MQTVSKSARLWALADLVLIITVFLAVREWMRALDVIPAGSIGIVSAVAAGTITMKLRGGSWIDLGLRPPDSRKGWMLTIGLSIIVVATVFAAVPVIVVPVLRFLFEDLQWHGSGSHFEFLYGRPLVLIAYIVVVAWIGAAFGEEMFSRGLMMNRLAEVFGFTNFGWIVALIGQAVFFGAAHAYQGTVGMVMAGSVGFVFGAFYLIGKRNLWPLILAHGIVDTIGLTQLYLANPV